MVNKSNKRDLAQIDKEFKKACIKIQGEILMRDGKRISLTDVTRMINDTPAFKEVKKQILNGEFNGLNFKIKMDKRLFT